MKNLLYYSELSYKILNEETKYQIDKKIISDIFRMNRSNPVESIILRLTIIDSYYSTQLNKRYFGIEEIAEKIEKISPDDSIVKNKLLMFLENFDNEIVDLFNNSYGYRKNGKKVGSAHSLISKYAYFLTDFQFPIYDKLVKISYPFIKIKYPELDLKILPDSFDISFFKIIRELNIKSKINNYEKLDNLLWLYGKIREGSFSLILNREKYLKFVNNLNIPNDLSSIRTDNFIRKYIIENIDSEIIKSTFSVNSLEFIKFCLSDN